MFVLSRHAKERIIERGLEVPTAQTALKSAGKKMRRKIRDACKENGIDDSKVYFFKLDGTVYVCEQIDICKYLVITAFKIQK